MLEIEKGEGVFMKVFLFIVLFIVIGLFAWQLVLFIRDLIKKIKSKKNKEVKKADDVNNLSDSDRKE